MRTGLQGDSFMKRTLYVVALCRAEAVELAEEIGWQTREEAEDHLEACKRPPTDWFYANKLQIFSVERPS